MGAKWRRESQNTGLLSIELNDQFRRALEIMENTHKNVFVTGRTLTQFFAFVAKHSSAR